MKRYAPAAARNRGPILKVLRQVLPATGTILEIASGTGEHAIHFAEALSRLEWQPSDVDPAALESLAAHAADAALTNLRPGIVLDSRDDDWGAAANDVAAIVCINMIHIAPWACCEGLVRGAGRTLDRGAPLVTYGPYRFDGSFTAPSNETFDAALRHRDASWGVRDLSDVERIANTAGLDLARVVDMPANNHIVVFHRR